MVSHPSAKQALEYLTSRQDHVHSDSMTESTTVLCLFPFKISCEKAKESWYHEDRGSSSAG